MATRGDKQLVKFYCRSTLGISVLEGEQDEPAIPRVGNNESIVVAGNSLRIFYAGASFISIKGTRIFHFYLFCSGCMQRQHEHVNSTIRRLNTVLSMFLTS